MAIVLQQSVSSEQRLPVVIQFFTVDGAEEFKRFGGQSSGAYQQPNRCLQDANKLVPAEHYTWSSALSLIVSFICMIYMFLQFYH